jgi:hypothetical protein
LSSVHGARQHPRAREAAVALHAGVVAALLALCFGLAFFAYPSADDFCFAAKERLLGFADAQRHWYITFTGRYASTAAISAFAAAGDVVRLYPLAAVAVLGSTVASFTLLAWAMLRRLGAALLAGATASLLFFTMTPDVAQTFYWLSGSFTYQLGNVAVVVLVACVLLSHARDTPRKVADMIVFVAGALAIIVAAGANEISLVLTLVIASGAAIVEWRSRGTLRARSMLWLAIAIVAAAASIAAPGNFVRLDSVAVDPQLRPGALTAVLAFVPWVVLRLCYWLANPALWAAAFIVLWISSGVAATRFYANGRFRRSTLIVPIAWLATIVALNAIGFAVNRYPLPERAESVVALVFLLGWFPSFVIVAHAIIGPRAASAGPAARNIATFVLVISLLGAPAIFDAYKDVYRGYRYAGEMAERFAALRASQGNGAIDVSVASISRPPRTLFATDVVTDAANFRNTCVAEYFGVRSVSLRAPAR